MKRLVCATLVASAIALLTAFAIPASAASNLGNAIALGADAQVVWFDQASFGYDTELGGKGALSITPHISGVASVHYGLGQQYGRADAGARFTLTDVSNPNFSIGVGLEREWLSKQEVGQDQWVTDVTVGQKVAPWCILGAQGAYGLQSKTTRVSAGIVVPFKVVKGGQ